MKFVPRLTAPSTTDKNWIHYSKGGFNTAIIIDNATGSVLPNCVGYWAGRQLELTGATKENWSIPVCNAEDCYDMAIKNGYKVGSTPKLGAGIVWRAGSTHNNADGAGHIAVVEEIRANGDIVVSQSAYGGNRFYTTVLTKASGYIYNATRPLVGFIYCPVVFDEVTPEQPKAKTVTAGAEAVLKNTPCYTSETNPKAYGVKTGTYYLWDAKVYSGRIRITNSKARVGVAGQVTCWVNVADIGFSAPATQTPKAPTVTAGAKATLSNTPCYASEDTSKSYGVKTGTFYLWDSVVKNGRIRITNSKSRVGVAGQVTCWVKVSDIKLS